MVEYCINHSDTRIVFAAPVHIPQLLKLAKSCPKLKALISLDSWGSLESKSARPGVSGEKALKAWGEEVGIQVLDLAEGEWRAGPHLVEVLLTLQCSQSRLLGRPTPSLTAVPSPLTWRRFVTPRA